MVLAGWVGAAEVAWGQWAVADVAAAVGVAACIGLVPYAELAVVEAAVLAEVAVVAPVPSAPAGSAWFSFQCYGPAAAVET